MKEFNDLQHIWKSGIKEPENMTRQSIPENLLKELKELESFQDRINRIKLLVIVLLIISMFCFLYLAGIGSVAVYAGLGMVILGVILFMTIYLRSQFTSRKLNFSDDSLVFADSAIQMLKKQNAVFKLPFLIFVLLLIIGFNVIVSGLDISLKETLILRVYNTVLIAACAFIGYKFRMRRIRNEVNPIIHELTGLKDSLNLEKE